jgi:hypothetical protein
MWYILGGLGALVVTLETWGIMPFSDRMKWFIRPSRDLPSRIVTLCASPFIVYFFVHGIRQIL